MLSERVIPQRLIYVDGYAIRYLDYDSHLNKSSRRKFLVLLHGLGASAERWMLVADTLSKHFRVIIPDIIGFGYSDKPTVEYTREFFIEFFKGFLEGLNITQPILVGSSFGGYLLQNLQLSLMIRLKNWSWPTPAGMMRSSTECIDQYIMAALYPTYENALRGFMDMAFDPSIVTEETIRDFINRMRLPNAKYAFMSTLLGIRDSPRLYDRLDKIRAPTLLIWGDSDKMIRTAIFSGLYEDS